MLCLLNTAKQQADLDYGELRAGDLGRSHVAWTDSSPISATSKTCLCANLRFFLSRRTDPGWACSTGWEQPPPNSLHLHSFTVFCLEIVFLAPIQINSNRDDQWKWSYRWDRGGGFRYNSLLLLRYALGVTQNYLFGTALSGHSRDLSELIKVWGFQGSPAFT